MTQLVAATPASGSPAARPSGWRRPGPGVLAGVEDAFLVHFGLQERPTAGRRPGPGGPAPA